MTDKVEFDARNHADNVGERKFVEIPYLDTAGLQEALESLRVTFNLPAAPPDRVVMECWEEYRHKAKREFLQGFDDGYFGRGPDKPRMSEPDIGPLPIHLISLEILNNDEANVFKVPES